MFQYTAKLVRVVDGDTVDFAVDLGFNVWINERFRLLGIDTPELSSSDPEVRVKAAAAKQALITLLLDTSVVTIETKKQKGDKYGRWLAVVKVEGMSVNEEMVRLGHAVTYDGGAKP
jgi:micrococcal nuclease